jgi:P protein
MLQIRLSDVSRLNPKNIIIALVLFSNIGGTSTAIGDPPNVRLIFGNNLNLNF